MRTRSGERIKDIIIDHVYSRCYDAIARKIEGEDADEKYPGDDADMQKIYETFIKTSGEVRIFHDLRRATHCRIIVDRSVEPLLTEKLDSEGFQSNARMTRKVEDALRFLVNRSYLIKKYPANSEYTLTTKGVEHYSSGRSFEEAYLNGRTAKIALTFSIVSVVAAAAAIAMNLPLFK
ncbi:MAG TPA: hypothetical protein VHO46_01535 [Bacteroidales bacterium]|nr:hypothetical protein [Bacteroidales bacterium]